MTAWWDTIAGAADGDRDTPTRRSVYDSRDLMDATAPSQPDSKLPTHTVNVAGFRVEVPVCCADPALCEREECWTRLASNFDGIRGVR